MVSKSDMSEAYAAMAAWSSGSSGNSPSALIHRQLADVSLIDRMRLLEPVDQLVPPGFEPLEEGGQGLGSGHLGHGELMVEAFFVVVE
jgi:hypothetical protein